LDSKSPVFIHKLLGLFYYGYILTNGLQFHQWVTISPNGYIFTKWLHFHHSLLVCSLDIMTYLFRKIESQVSLHMNHFNTYEITV